VVATASSKLLFIATSGAVAVDATTGSWSAT
jgi:hypothetical protein